ncbi:MULTISPECIES: ABC transporter permease [unclassified Gilliamella]|uniref:ABC transporter permease n=1 Tax=unclassified Gilliamella TaxID=2685620 RepID=UPI00080E2841|nr:microcin C ABC transporter permease [Gilliamella apicola]MCO6554005.1 ABC transporter permease subunit [Gilliamella sp.]MCO6555672.1 ABC transporter permease subunit [Gilliamella sp.]OCG30248.1 microcin ABC transporter permease [Gilliamella apicola]OCG37795.1 microcin ABC transporter permease [Gilliamella apicola]OCG49614.1 microcin ABC transporter permease [Gilliamella apicola]
MTTHYSINQQRWQRFKQNRRGYYSLWLFMICFVISLFADFIVNDRPIFIKYQDNYYSPIFHFYPETEFGGQLATQTNFLDPAVQNKIEANGWILWAPFRYSYNTLIYDTSNTFPTPPSASHWLGTTDAGFDVLANILYGFRISMFFAIFLTIFTSIIGVIFGAIQGYYGGKIDLIGQRFIEIWSGLPELFVIILLASILPLNFWWLLGITVLFGWMALVGVVRTEFLRTRNFDYIRAAKAMGVSDTKIMFRHILPNAMVATLTFLPFILCGSITTLTALDFLGFGLPIDSPSLGRLLLQGKNNLQAPWLGISSFLVIATLLSLLIFIGEAVRDAFDPNKGVY